MKPQNTETLTEETPTPVTKDPIFEDFIYDRNLTKSSINIYRNRLQKYVDYQGMSLTELLEEAEEEQDINVKKRKRKIRKRLSDYRNFLIDSGHKVGYVSSCMRSVKSFYDEFEIDLPRKKRRNSRKLTEKRTIKDLPDFKEINKFMNHCNNLYRFILILGLSSGMGRAEICNLTYKHLYDGLNIYPIPKTMEETIHVVKKKVSSGIVPRWDIIRVKTGNEYFTFSSLQSMELFLDYLEDYHHKYPNFNPEPENHLIRSLNGGHALNVDAVGNQISWMNRYYGGRIAKDGRFAVRTHAMRKLFASILEKNQVPYLETKWLLGHKVTGSDGAYFYPDPDEVKDHYLSVMQELTTDKSEIKIINSLPDLAEQIEQLKREKIIYKDKI